MAGTTSYPASVDTFTDPNPTDATTSPSHAQLHQNVHAALTAVETNTLQSVRGGRDKVVTASVGAATYTISLTGGNVIVLTLTGNGALVFPSGFSTSEMISFQLVLKQDATGGRTRTWPGSVSWGSGGAPTLSTGANKQDVLAFESWDGGNTWDGYVKKIGK